MLIASLLFLASFSGGAVDPAAPSMLLGLETRQSKTLLSEDAEGLYALQLTTRDNRLCQVRAFFRGAPPRCKGWARVYQVIAGSWRCASTPAPARK